VRTIPEFVRAMCMTDEEENLYLLCYGPASIRGRKLAFEIDTAYPFRQDLILTITRAEGANLYVRIPAWCKKPLFEKDGVKCALVPTDGGFMLLDETLRAGDVIHITFPMEVTAEIVNDADMSGKYPIMYKRGPLVYALPIPTQWSSYEGTPRTPLPKGWSWFEAQPDFTGTIRFKEPWCVAADEDLDVGIITVTEKESSYVWSEPAVELSVPMKISPYTYRHAQAKNLEPTGQVRETEGESFPVTLVPLGCTNLRITYFPRQKKG